MKKIYTTILLAFVAVCMYAQSPDATYVRMSFNDNPWNLPVSAIQGWSKYADENGILPETHTFIIKVNDEDLKMILTPSNYMLDEYENCMVRGDAVGEGNDGVIKTMLFTRTGSTMTFVAPPSMWMEKVAFKTYRRWSSGGLYSSEKETNGLHVWGKDSVKVRYYMESGVEKSYPCWDGDSVQWSLPECSSQTYLHWIDFWLLPRETAGITNLRTTDAKNGNILTLDGILVRRNGKLEGLRKGVYIKDGKKIVVK